jgi:hypothetical protein
VILLLLALYDEINTKKEIDDNNNNIIVDGDELDSFNVLYD